MKKDIKFYEAEILDSITKIEEYILGMTLIEFADDEKTFDACCMRLQHIGECGLKLSTLAGNTYKDIPLQEMSGFRNRISHDYAGIDDEIVWNTIQISLKDLKKKLMYGGEVENLDTVVSG
jgi:uncharacterized protein with HEPN domain